MTTNIEWTDETWNPVTGCTKVSAGCKHCYAETMWKRLSAVNMPYHGREFTDVQCHPDRLEKPLHWNKPRKVFVNSMSDLFHEDVPDEFIQEVFAIMAVTPHHTYQILTKRPDRMKEFMANNMNAAMSEGMAQRRYFEKTGEDPSMWLAVNYPLPNVWLGISCEDQQTANERIRLLLETQAAVRWISAEPLLGPISFSVPVSGGYVDALMGARPAYQPIDWVVVGGESGPKARPMNPDWARGIRDQCVDAGVPFFMKQITNDNGRKIPMGQWTEDLKIQEYPS